jgi:molybdenum cofactor biosynthesis enzyme MoaA
MNQDRPVESGGRDTQSLNLLAAAFSSSGVKFKPEESPFSTLFADITHRCNMGCKNCYIPVRDLPDLPADWLYEVVSRLPKRTRIRLVGAEPTMREDLPDIVSNIRQLGHIPIVLSNGLKLGRRGYVNRLKEAGLGTVYLSLNGGLQDALYEEIDGMAVAERKLRALDNLIAARLHVTTGMILVPGVNIDHLPEFLRYLLDRGIRDMHFRSIGEVGNYMQGKSLKLGALEEIIRRALPTDGPELKLETAFSSSRDFQYGRAVIQLTEWPELGSMDRGRITPEGFVEPMFESIMANENHY